MLSKHMILIVKFKIEPIFHYTKLMFKQYLPLGGDGVPQIVL